MTASLPPSTFRNLTMCRPAHAPMTWELILADRIARGLETPPAAPPQVKAPKVKRAAKSTGPRMVNGADARHPSNLTPCTVPAFTGKRPTTAAGAAKIRRELMAQCACRLCNLALRPPLTFADHALFCPGGAERNALEGFRLNTFDKWSETR